MVNAGHKKVVDDPDNVSIKDALSAAKIRSDLGKKGTNINILVGLFGGGSSAGAEPIIEGTVREV